MRSLHKVITLVSISAISTAYAQTPKEDTRFDVVSIREIPASTTTVYSPARTVTIGVASKPCQFRIARVLCQLSLFDLVRDAYQLDRNELEASSALKDHVFIFEATMSDNTNQTTARLMLQQALKERFHLVSHREDKVIEVYAMVPAKGGLKLQPIDPEHRNRLKPMLSYSMGHFESTGITLDYFGLNLRKYAGLDRPIINKTGLNSEFKIDLHWDPTDDEEDSARNVDPNFRIAVEKQLGIRLEKQKVPMNIFVVDHIDVTPTAN